MAKPSPSFAGHPALVALGEAIRAERLAQGLSQEALADKAELDRSYVGGIERGEHNIAIINLLKIADALEVKVSSLLEMSAARKEMLIQLTANTEKKP
ncbi:MAG: helix-turn-helix domain-containing protein [Methylophilaceae bacterium]